MRRSRQDYSRKLDRAMASDVLVFGLQSAHSALTRSVHENEGGAPKSTPMAAPTLVATSAEFGRVTRIGVRGNPG